MTDQDPNKSSPGGHNEPQQPGPWSPLKISLFRTIWIATVVSNIATWIHEVGAAWLMTSLAPSPLMVSLVQVATSLPLFVFALPAGAMADIFDRRRLLIMTQSWMMLAAIGMAATTYLGVVNPTLLLMFTFALGIGAALNAPAWQAIVPELVPRQQLSAAVSINSVGFNVARAIGPAIGGLIVAAAGADVAFALNAVSFVGVIYVLYSWRRIPTQSELPPERFFEAMVAGLRYARYAPNFRNVLGRAILFIFPASALWALLPILSRQELNMSASGYGAFLGAGGFGALLGAYFLPRLRKKVRGDYLAGFATGAFGLSLFALSALPPVQVVFLLMLINGATWLCMLSSLNVSAQTVSAPWVRARALSVSLLCFFGSMAAGSFIWGALASITSIPVALTLAAVLSLVGILAGSWLPLDTVEGLDLSPSQHWPIPAVNLDPDDKDKTVLITIEYFIDPKDAKEFHKAMNQLRLIRLRDGAIQWQLFRDNSSPERYLESFQSGSWLQHLRHHERVAESDKDIQMDIVRRFHRGEGSPNVTHFQLERTDS